MALPPFKRGWPLGQFHLIEFFSQGKFGLINPFGSHSRSFLEHRNFGLDCTSWVWGRAHIWELNLPFKNPSPLGAIKLGGFKPFSPSIKGRHFEKIPGEKNTLVCGSPVSLARTNRGNHNGFRGEVNSQEISALSHGYSPWVTSGTLR